MKTVKHGRTPNPIKDQNPALMEPKVYRIRVEGHLGDHWTACFEGMTLSQEQDGTTVLIGPLVDQAALHGLLVRIGNMGLPLISVNRIAGCLWNGDRSVQNEREGGTKG